MALILSLETSGTTCSVALYKEEVLLKTLEIDEPQAHAAKLAGLITKVFESTHTEIKKLNAVAISSGPGSYTGLRIGTSTAKGICFALGLPLIAVNTLDILAFQFYQKNKPDGALLCPLIDAKRMEVFYQITNENFEILQPVQTKVIDNKSFTELLSHNKLFFFGDGAEKCKHTIDHKNAHFVDGISVNALTLGVIAFLKFQKKEIENLVTFTPFYLKDFVAKKAKSVF